eukprot:TRINITY_DN20724_c0_g1_i1.p1 TRINITY_DN20724_c0_g1~~TRINITY_DN20724_c0_g1_i1.p1  ORF type:complete len:226 (+),score=4.36 TRINITY_DN20724_c0_g1_i1:3-680(+)
MRRPGWAGPAKPGRQRLKRQIILFLLLCPACGLIYQLWTNDPVRPPAVSPGCTKPPDLPKHFVLKYHGGWFPRLAGYWWTLKGEHSSPQYRSVTVSSAAAFRLLSHESIPIAQLTVSNGQTWFPDTFTVNLCETQDVHWEIQVVQGGFGRINLFKDGHLVVKMQQRFLTPSYDVYAAGAQTEHPIAVIMSNGVLSTSELEFTVEEELVPNWLLAYAALAHLQELL